MTVVPAEAFAFFDDLAADNSAAFWTANKARFDQDVKVPLAAILRAIEPEFGPFMIFRIHRDTRFSLDKSPLKTMYGAVDRASGLRYLHIDRDGVLLVCGAYIFDKVQRDAWREAVASHKTGADIEAAITALQQAGIPVTPGGAAPMTRLPRGHQAEGARSDLLRWKGCMATLRLDRAQIAKTHVADHAIAFWAATSAFWTSLSQVLCDNHGAPIQERAAGMR